MIRYRTRRIIKTEDLNSNGTLFGGRLLEWVDEEASIFTFCQLGQRSIVTKFMSSIEFQSPAFLGDVIEFGTDIVSFGTSSMTLKCHVRNKKDKRPILMIDKIVFVAVDGNMNPEPHSVTEFTAVGRWSSE